MTVEELYEKEMSVANHIRAAANDGCICDPCIAAREALHGWIPIEKAPRKFGNRWLGLNANAEIKNRRVMIIVDSFEPNEEFSSSAPRACWTEPGCIWPSYPTHYQPLPDVEVQAWTTS